MVPIRTQPPHAAAVINASRTHPVAELKALFGGAQGVLVTAVSPGAFSQALGMSFGLPQLPRLERRLFQGRRDDAPDVKHPTGDDDLEKLSSRARIREALFDGCLSFRSSAEELR